MSVTVFLAVLLAAFLHASWNVMVRQNADRLISLVTLQSLMAFMGLGLIAWFGLPDQDSWPFVVVSGLLHTGYNLFLVRAYRAADLSQVYPVARGSAPLMTMIGAFFFLNDASGPNGVLIAAGAVLLRIA